MINPEFTWGELLRLNESDPQEAVKRFLYGISRPQEAKSQYPKVMLDRKEYNFAVSVWESGNRYAAIDLLESLAMASVEAKEISGRGLSLIGGTRKTKKKSEVNIYVKIFNSGTNPLNPVSSNDKTPGEYPFIEPGETYFGFAFFPYLAAWLRGGRIARLLGV